MKIFNLLFSVCSLSAICNAAYAGDVVTCEQLTANTDSKHVFNTIPLKLDNVSGYLPFGEMDPGGGESVPNTEGGFRITENDITIYSPGNLYVKTIEITHFEINGEFHKADAGFDFEVCKDVNDIGVGGHFSHIGRLSPSVVFTVSDALALQSSDQREAIYNLLLKNDITLMQSNPFEVDAARVFCEDPEPHGDGLVITRCFVQLKDDIRILLPEEKELGIAGVKIEDLPDFIPGLDFNLYDTREHRSMSPRINEEAWSYYYGACAPDYFAPWQREMLYKLVGSNFAYRWDGLGEDDDPCGHVDFQFDGGASGIWVRQDVSVDSEANPVMFDTHYGTFTQNIITLADHVNDPKSKNVFSTLIEALSSYEPGQTPVALVEFDKIHNVDFKQLPKNVERCISGNIEYHPNQEMSYFVYWSSDEGMDILEVQRIEMDCALAKAMDHKASIKFVR